MTIYCQSPLLSVAVKRVKSNEDNKKVTYRKLAVLVLNFEKFAYVPSAYEPRRQVIFQYACSRTGRRLSDVNRKGAND